MPEEQQHNEVTDPAEEHEGEELDQEDPQEGEAEEQEGEFDRDRALAKVKKLNSENRNLRQAKKDAEEKAKDAEGKTERMKALEATNSRYETLAQHDLPLKLARYISATDPEEVLEQAEELLSLGGTGSKTPPSDQPQEKRQRQRNQPYEPDELANPDDFAKTIYSN